MKQVVVKGGSVTVEEYPPPRPGPGEVLVRNAYSVISTGTERTAVKASSGSPAVRALKNRELIQKFITKVRTEGIKPAVRKAMEKLSPSAPPVTLGYSCAGEVVAVGDDVMDITPGMRVAAAGVGYASHAEYVRVPRNLVARVPEGVDLKEAAFTTIGAIAMHGLRRAGVTPGETVVIYGLGLLGLLALQMAKAWGLKTVGVDIADEKLKIAVELGCDLVLKPDGDMEQRVKAFTGGFGADASVVYASTTSNEPVNRSMGMLRHKGRVVVVGDVGLALSRALMYPQEIDVFIATSYGPGRYDPLYEEGGIDYPIGYVRWTENRNMEHFLYMLSAGQVKVEPLITGVYPVDDAPRAFEEVKSGRHIGVLFQYTPPEEVSLPVMTRSQQVPKNGRITLAFVGPGAFAKAVHLPNLKKMGREFYLKYLVGRNPVKTAEVADKFGFEKACTDLQPVLEDDSVDLVILSTPHSQHAEQVVKSLMAGKAVFVEKPLCVTFEELEEIRNVLAETGGRIAVGFNRRYSPFARSLKQLMEHTGEPGHVLYRVNAGYLPPDHWVHKKEEGGRLIGEGCHFINFFIFLTGSEPLKINAQAIPPDGARYVEPDSFTVSMLMKDGSQCTLVYTARGHTTLAKEYVEVHTGGVSAVMDNFVALKVYGSQKDLPSGVSSMRLSEQNKGLVEELQELVRFLRGEENTLISNEECIVSTEATLIAHRRLRGNEEEKG